LQACFQVIGVDLEAAQALSECVQDEYGFVPVLDPLLVPGLCATCAAKDG